MHNSDKILNSEQLTSVKEGKKGERWGEAQEDYN